MLATPSCGFSEGRGSSLVLKVPQPPAPTPGPPPPRPPEARTGSAGPLLPRLCPPVGLRPLRRGDRAVIRFVQVGGGSSPAPGAPPSSDLSAPLRGAVPACQLIWPQSSPGRGGRAPAGWRGWGPQISRPPASARRRGAGGAGFAPTPGAWQDGSGRGGLCALRGPTRAWVAAAPAAGGG